MDVKEAINLARNYVRDVFAEEQITEIGLEEVEFDELTNTWRVTVGFTRPWDHPSLKIGFQHLMDTPPFYQRTYKLLTISDKTSRVLSVKNRERSDA